MHTDAHTCISDHTAWKMEEDGGGGTERRGQEGGGRKEEDKGKWCPHHRRLSHHFGLSVEQTQSIVKLKTNFKAFLGIMLIPKCKEK